MEFRTFSLNSQKKLYLKESLQGYKLINSYTYDQLSPDNYTFVEDKDFGAYNVSYNVSSFWEPSYSVESKEGYVQ